MKQMCEKAFRWRINELFREENLSIQKFAEKCGISRQSMQYYLTGERMPDSACLLKICEACFVSADWLLGLSEVRKPSADLRFVCEYTGLSEEIINWITNLDPAKKHAFDTFLSHEEFDDLISTYTGFLNLIHSASKHFKPGTPGAGVGAGDDGYFSIKENGTVEISSIWQVLILMGHEIASRAERIAEYDRMYLWEIGDQENKEP